MKLEHEIKFEITDEDKLGIYIYAYRKKYVITAALMLVAGICRVAATLFFGWKYGLVAFLAEWVASLLFADGLFAVLMSKAIDKVVKQKIAEQ